MGEIRALSQDECCHLLRVVGTNSSPFRRVRDRAMIFTFLLTGARLREIVQLDRADVDLHQSTIRLHRKGGEINVLPLADTAKIEIKAYLKHRRKRSRARALFIFLPESKNRAWHSLVFSEEIFQENSDKRKRNGTSRFTAHICDLTFKPGRKSQNHSESYEPQESFDDGSVSALAKSRVGKSRERSQAVGRLERGVVQSWDEIRPLSSTVSC
jgi:integrase